MKKVRLLTGIIAVCCLVTASYLSNARENVSEKMSINTVAEPEGTKTLHVEGGVTVTWIRDNVEESLRSRATFPDASDSLIEELGLQDGIPSSTSAFLVEVNGIKVLVDTGNGGTRGCTLERLKNLGIDPKDISYLFITHYHGDHIGGMMDGDKLVFPNAEVYAGRVEHEAWMNMAVDKNALQVKTMNAYKDHLHLFEFGDTLPGGFVAMDAVGHTPGHTAFQVGKLLIVADIIHGAALQLKHPEICASFDMDKTKAVESRKRLLKYAKDNQLVIAGSHLPSPAFIENIQ